jgi:hypothetical protein
MKCHTLIPKRSRREWSDWLKSFREGFERYAIYVVVANVGVFWLVRWSTIKNLLLCLWEQVPKHDNIHIEALVVGVETATVTLALAKALWDLFAIKDESKFWSNGCNRETIASLASWFRGDGIDLGKISRLVSAEFAVAPDVRHTISDFNHRAYENGYFGLRRDALFQRNTAIMHKNPYTFLLYKDKNSDDKPFAFSCVLPLNEAAAEDYLEARIPDSGFKERHIAAPDEKPHLIVLFALALDPDFKIPPGGKRAGNYPSYIAGCLQYHFQYLLSCLKEPMDCPRIVVQAETWRTRKTYKALGFFKTQIESADRMKFLEMKVPFANSPEGERNGQIKWIDPHASQENLGILSQTESWSAFLPSRASELLKS